MFGKHLISGATLQKHALAVVDQGIVSGANLATTVIIGRACGAAQLGVYSLAFTILVLITCVQTSIATSPYIYFGSVHKGEKQRFYAGSTLLEIVVVAALATMSLVLLASVLGIGRFTMLDGRLVLILAVVVPFILLRDFLRRFALAHLQIASAVLLDGLVAVIQLIILLLLAKTASLTALTAHAGIGFSSGLVAVCWLLIGRRQFTLRRDQHVSVFRQNWSFGKWELASNVVIVVHGYLIHWILAFQLGLEVTGVFVACMSIINLLRPLIYGLSNTLEPQTARALTEGGVREVRRFVLKITLFFAVVVGVFAGILALFGATIVEMIYGDSFGDVVLLMGVLSLSRFISVLDYGAIFGLRAMGHTVWNFAGSLVGLVLVSFTAFLLLPPLGLIGGPLALLAGNTGAMVVRTGAFFRLAAAAEADNNFSRCCS
ncbi:MAG: hypothetical protein GY697_12175 [Desulfobacterales bacterium]|nr:hypothetical protein [Desulfobacterales bacterium]